MLARLIRRSAALLALTASCSLAGCANDPSTMLRVPANGPMPSASDERNGVLAVQELLADGTYETTLRRVDGAATTTLTPPIPDGHAGRIWGVAWRDGQALVGDLDGHLYRYTGGDAWETLSTSDCDPSTPDAWLVDAPAIDDAWLLAVGNGGGSTLCHFDGTHVDARETLGFFAQEVVEHDGTLYAMDPDAGVVRRRALTAGSTWESVRGVEEGTTQISEIVVRDDGVYAHFESYDVSTWWSVSGRTATAIEGMPGLTGERWRLDQTTTTSTHCGSSWFDGHEVCTDNVDTLDLHVMRVDGGQEREAGYLHVEQPGTRWYEAYPVGDGRLLLGSSSGEMYVTPGGL